MEAIILTGGRGERMRPFTDTAPKPMVPIQGRPLIFHQLSQLREAGIQKVTIYESYLPEAIQGYLKNGVPGMAIEHRVLDLTNGSAGCVKAADLRLPPAQ